MPLTENHQRPELYPAFIHSNVAECWPVIEPGIVIIFFYYFLFRIKEENNVYKNMNKKEIGFYHVSANLASDILVRFFFF